MAGKSGVAAGKKGAMDIARSYGRFKMNFDRYGLGWTKKAKD